MQQQIMPGDYKNDDSICSKAIDKYFNPISDHCLNKHTKYFESHLCK